MYFAHDLIAELVTRMDDSTESEGTHFRVEQSDDYGTAIVVATSADGEITHLRISVRATPGRRA